jgi:hypothetical protein
VKNLLYLMFWPCRVSGPNMKCDKTSIYMHVTCYTIRWTQLHDSLCEGVEALFTLKTFGIARVISLT